MHRLAHATFGALLSCTFLSGLYAADELKSGTPELKHAGALAFAPDGVLLVGDSLSASVFAIATSDGSSTEKANVNIEGINQKIAAMVGSSVDDTTINDMAVNPMSGNVYLSVSRGRGPDATPILFKADAKGNLSEVSLKDVKFAKASFENAPESGQDRRGQNPRMSAITDIQYQDGKVIVAGLSNEEFASKLRVFNYPFDGQESSTSIEVYHGAHGALETRSPVRTFITYENTVLAAYTCTPLVTIPVGDLNGEKVRGKTIAELGNRNTPLDMIVYKKGDEDYLLMANTARGVMKLKLDKPEFDAAKSIDSRVADKAGVPYETISDFENVVQLDKLNEQHAVLLVTNASNLDLKTVALP
ncbi:MAG: hypothetical protein R3C53_23280 [Pirellulaceae bacterium]